MCSVTKVSGGKVTERNLRPCYKVSGFQVLLFLLHKFFTEEKGGKKEDVWLPKLYCLKLYMYYSSVIINQFMGLVLGV